MKFFIFWSSFKDVAKAYEISNLRNSSPQSNKSCTFIWRWNDITHLTNVCNNKNFFESVKSNALMPVGNKKFTHT